MGVLMKGLCLLVAGVIAGASAAYAEDLVETTKRSVEIQTFADAMNNAGLTNMLKNKGPFTIFVPSNAAFNRLPSDQKNALLSDRGSAEKLVASHVIPGRILITEIKPGKTQTINGSTITLTSDNGLVKVEGASVIQSDIIADNGVIHVIDTVVLPEN
jgi:uncharacterized surface protein with fasciclin (FAS1) repeats